MMKRKRSAQVAPAPAPGIAAAPAPPPSNPAQAADAAGLTESHWAQLLALAPDHHRHAHFVHALLPLVQRGGIASAPPDLRPQAWRMLLGAAAADAAQEEEEARFAQLTGLASDAERAEAHFQEGGGTEPWAQCERRILMDSNRIGADGPLFSGAARAAGVARLGAVLRAYALADPPVGYVQGMTDLLAPLLQLYDSDAAALAAFERLMGRPGGGCRACFTAGMPGLRTAMAQLAALLAVAAPRLHTHLAGLGAGGYEFALQPLLLALKRNVAWPDVFRLWEALWAYEAHEGGGCSLTVHAVAALLLRHRRGLEACRGLEEVVQYVNAMPPAGDVLGLAAAAHQLHVSGGRSAGGGGGGDGGGLNPGDGASCGCYGPKRSKGR